MSCICASAAKAFAMDTGRRDAITCFYSWIAQLKLSKQATRDMLLLSEAHLPAKDWRPKSVLGAGCERLYWFLCSSLGYGIWY